MDLGVELAGEAELTDRLARTQAGILDLSGVNRDMVSVVARKSDTIAPRSTGTLASGTTTTATATGWGLVNTVPYAPPVFFGTRYMRARPWLLDAARATEDDWMDDLTKHVQQLLD